MVSDAVSAAPVLGWRLTISKPFIVADAIGNRRTFKFYAAHVTSQKAMVSMTESEEPGERTGRH